MTDGKLVRDLIPDIIRQAGKDPNIRYLSGSELVKALAAKLQEEAAEAAEATSDRDSLVEELADVYEVMSTLMKLNAISIDEVTQVARAKAEQRGHFNSGAFLVSTVPSAIRRWRVADVDAHRVTWFPDRWRDAFAGHEQAYSQLMGHSREEGGIARAFIHNRADHDPVGLFLMAMAWGFGPRGYGPSRTEAILKQHAATDEIKAIVETTRLDGAGAGWNALLNTHHIKGFGMSFGTKLLYFAGYSTSCDPRPLILDERVRAALQCAAPGTVPAEGRVRQADYIRYLQQAETWACDPAWRQTPEVVEYGLFAM